MSELIAVLLVGAGTYFSRSIFIVLLATREIPGRVRTVLQFVAPAVLSALVVAVLPQESGRLDVGLPELLALGVGAVVARATRNHVYTLLAGMCVFLIATRLT